jgi:hypothetical protein
VKAGRKARFFNLAICILVMFAGAVHMERARRFARHL